MCNHHHKKAYLTHLPKTCKLPMFFTSVSKENIQFNDLPIDQTGKCIFHSSDIDWKQTNQCTERFIELLALMQEAEQIKDLDCREFQLVGFKPTPVPKKSNNETTIREVAAQLDGKPLGTWGGKVVPLINIKIDKPLRFQGAIFHDDLLLRDSTFTESIDFDEAIFKGMLSFEHCQFQDTVSFINGCRMEKNVIIDNCVFEELFDMQHATILAQLYVSQVHFKGKVFFNGLNHINVSSLCLFAHVHFEETAYFVQTVFRSPVIFDECHFTGETHFEGTTFQYRLQLVKPTILGMVYFIGDPSKEKLFHDSVDIEVETTNFGPYGQIVFQNANLFNLDANFKSQLKNLELNHKVEIRSGCLLYRTSIERVFSYSRFNHIILESINQAFSNYFETFHQQVLQIDVIRDLPNNQIKVIYHTEESISIDALEHLLFQTKKEILTFVSDPKSAIKNANEKALLTDHFLELQNVWQRHFLALSNQLLETSLLEELMTQNKDGKVDDTLKNLFGLTINVHIKNMVKDSWLEVGGDLQIGDE